MKATKGLLVGGFTALFLASCVGPLSNSGFDVADDGNGIVFPLSAVEADRVLATSMIATFPSTPIVAMTPWPNRGYTATITFLTDSHTITGIATPATGIRADGEVVEGYTFSVFNSGTIKVFGGDKARQLFAQINTRAAIIGTPIPAAH